MCTLPFSSVSMMDSMYILYIALSLVIKFVGACKNCTSSDFTRLQLSCADSITSFADAESHYAERNHSNLCSFLFQFYFCVGEKVPVCLHKITGSYGRYYASPWDCHPDRNVTLKLQQYMIKANDCSTDLQKFSTHSPKDDVTYNVITTQQAESPGKHNSLNGTNSAITNVSPPRTLLLTFSWLFALYVEIV